MGKMKKKTKEAANAGHGQVKDYAGPGYDLSIFQSLRRIIRALDIHSRKLSSDFGITGPQLVCLQSIVEEGPLTQLELSRKIHLSASTVVGILDRLEQKELVKKERDQQDRRRIFVSSTSDGKKLVARAPSPLQDALKEALSEMGELEQAAIALSLEKIVDLLDAGHIDAAPILDAGPISESKS